MNQTATPPSSSRRRAIAVLLAAGAIGALIRFGGLPTPVLLSKYGGDAAWSAAWASGTLALWPALGRTRACAVAFTIAAAVECFQATGIPAQVAHHGFAVRLLLGTTFGWWEFPCYAAGVLIAWFTLGCGNQKVD